MPESYLGYPATDEVFRSQRTLVYRSCQPGAGRPVVLKVMRQPHPSREATLWFKREFELLQQLAGVDGVVGALELGYDKNRWVMVMEDVGGSALAASMGGRPMREGEFLNLAARVAGIVARIHAADIVHKDINPANIVLHRGTGAVRLIDFGVATRLPRETTRFESPAEMEGTLAYMAPEQTGRMNRSVDFRSDLYGLGATFYELLAGVTPFAVSDPIALVHAHLARQPRPLLELRPQLSPVLARIVEKLLAKAPEDRYQSADGLQLDLEECLRQERESATITAFELDRRSPPTRMLLPEKLYGRERELAQLLTGFERAVAGGVEVMLVAGYSGVGKSALVSELYQPITRQAGFFIAGKFDQLQRDAPYSVVIQALQELVRQVLGEPQERLDAWRDQLLDALGPNAQILLDVIPELALVIGAQPQAAELASGERLNVLLLAFSGVFKVFAAAAHPLTIFLDDLQCVDAASLRLLESVVLDPGVSHLYVIGAYRDNEVAAGHPLELLTGRLRRAGVQLQTLSLAPLGPDHVGALIADATGRTRADVAALSAMIISKTGGNPFFTKEFLKRLVAEKLIFLDRGRWSWEHRAIRERDITENVLELVEGQLRELADATAGLLVVAGALGSQLTLKTLAVAAQRPVGDVWRALWPAIEAGLLIVMSDAYKLVGIDLSEEESEIDVPLRFAHDRIQQAALALAPPEEHAALSWTVGGRLRARWPTATNDDRIFEIVNHLNAGRAYAKDQDERDELAALNLAAARRARASAAFAAGYQHAQIGMELGGATFATRDYALAMGLVAECVETAYQTGDYAGMEAWVGRAVAAARELVDLAWIYEIRTEAYNAQGRPLDAIAHALDYLDALGVHVPRAPSFDDVGAEMGAAAALLETRSIAQLQAAPDIADPAIRVAVGLMAKIYSSAYVASPLLFVVVCLKQFQLVARHGNCAASALSYAVYGLIRAAIANDVDGGYAFGALSGRMLERPDIKRFEAQARHLFNCHTRMWKEHLSACVDGERLAYRAGLDTGELEFACYGAHVAAKYALFQGQDLDALRAEMEQYTGAMRRYQQDIACNSHLPWHQAALNLSEIVPNPHRLAGAVLDARAARPALEAVNDRMSISNALTAELILCTVYSRFPEAVAIGSEGNHFLDAVLSQFNQPVHMFFDALARCAVCHDTPADARAELRAVADKSLETLRGWARSAPENLAQKVLLLEAEALALEGRPHEARDRYDDAIECSRRHGFLLDEAVANEAAARQMIRTGRHNAARHYLEDAHAAYTRWGALGVAADLEARFPMLAVKRTPESPLAATRTVGNSRDARIAVDIAAVLRAAEALNSEVVLSRLLRRLLVTLMENAGATRAVLVLDDNGQPKVEAVGTADGAIDVLLGRPLIGADGAVQELPGTMFQYTMRSGTVVLADDAAANARFGKDPYVVAHATRSALCVPIKSMGAVTGVVYLENNSLPGAFTAARAELVTLLAGQIAISIENALLYASMEQRVAERTQQLEARNTFIREVFGRYMADEVVDTLLESKAALRLGGERRVLTVMFTDLRGFTALCERLSPEHAVRTLNNYLAEMTAIIQRNGGTINSLIGDGIMVLFGAPIWREDHVDRALVCALEMQRAMVAVNATNLGEGLPELSMGIGLHTGEVVVGNVGSSTHAKYSAIGRHVNLSSRVESAAAGGEIFVSDATREAASLPLLIEGERQIRPKGVDRAVMVYSLVGVEGREDLRLADRVGTRRGLVEPRSLAVHHLDGKELSPRSVEGILWGIGPRSLELELPEALLPGTDLALRGPAGLVYVKVVGGAGRRHIAMITGGEAEGL